MYTERLMSTHYTEAENREIEALYIGTESESRKRFHRSRSQSQQRGQPQEKRLRSFSRNRYSNSRSSSQDQRSRYDRFKSTSAQGSQDRCDWSQSQSNARPQYSPQCIGCKCFTCTENVKTCKRIEEIILRNVDIKLT